MTENKKILLTQFWTDNISYSKYTKAINERYCIEQNYIYHIENDENKIKNKIGTRAFTWYKPFLLLDVLEKYEPDYVLFLDADAVVVNNDYRIESFIDDDFDIICTEDYGPSLMNAGVLLIKNTEWVKTFLNEWWEVCDTLGGGPNNIKGFYENGLWHDQTCFSHLLKTYPNVENHIKVIDNKVLNGRYFNDTENKNFIFHAFSYGQYRNRTLDTAYYNLFKIPIPTGTQLLDIVEYYRTDKHYEHNFFNLIYNDLFKEIYEDVKTFIEIGIYECESIKLWRDYFINAEIIGVDYNLPYSLNKFGSTSQERMTFINADQSKEEDLIKLSDTYSNVDVIIDDGSHLMRDQQITLAKLFKMLKSNGIFILEDLHTSIELKNNPNHWTNWGDINKTLTLDMLKDYQKTGKIVSDYMTQDEMNYLNENIKSVEIYQSSPDWSVTSVIIKK